MWIRTGTGGGMDRRREAGGVVTCEIPQTPLAWAYGNPENTSFFPSCCSGAALSRTRECCPLWLKPLSLFVPCTTACGIPWQQIWRWCHMGEISQTKTSIECSLYSPIPAVEDGPLSPNIPASDLTVPRLDEEQRSDCYYSDLCSSSLSHIHELQVSCLRRR